MAEPAKPLPDMTDEEEGWLTDGEKDSGAAISDYRAGEQRNVSDQSGKEAQCNVNEEEDHGSSCEKVGHFSDSDDFKEKAEIFHDAIMAKGSDTCREKGNRLFKEKKLKEALENYNNAERLGRECRVGFLRNWKGLVKTYCNIGHCLNTMGKFAEAEEMCYKAIDLDPIFPKSYIRLSTALMGQGKGNTDLAICALYKGKELPDVKSDELSTFNVELKKLGISGDRGELTQAGRDLDIQEVRKRRVDVRQGTSLFTVKEVSQSHGFAFNFGLRKNCPTLSRKGLSSFPQTSGRGKESKKGSGEDVPGLMDESSSDEETSPSIFTNLKIKKDHGKPADSEILPPPVNQLDGQGNDDEQLLTGARPKGRRVMIPCSRERMEFLFKSNPGEAEKGLEEQKQRNFEKSLLEGDVAFLKGQMLKTIEKLSGALSLAPKEWLLSIQSLGTRYQLARACIEVATSSSLAQGFSLMKGMEEECRDEKHCKAMFSNSVHFLFVLLFKRTRRTSEARKHLELARNKVKSCKPLLRASDGLPLPETNPESLRKELAFLFGELKHPERPDAVCRHAGCIDSQRKKEEKPYLPLPTTSIYLEPPDIAQYVTVTCFEGCRINFHSGCWEELKIIKLQCRSPRDKDFLGSPCLTPDCDGAVVGIVIKGRRGEVVRQTEEGKIIAKLEKEKRDLKNVLREERREKEEEAKRQKLEAKIAKMRFAQAVKNEMMRCAQYLENNNTQEHRGVVSVHTFGDQAVKVEKDVKIVGNVELAGMKKVKRKSTNCVGVIHNQTVKADVVEEENMNTVGTDEQEDVKADNIDMEESRRRVAFLQKMAEKLRAQLLNNSLAGILQEGSLDEIDTRQDLHGGEKRVRTNLVGLITAINEKEEELKSLSDLESRQKKRHITDMAQLHQDLQQKMAEKTHLEVELASVKNQAQKLQRENVLIKAKDAELREFKTELANQSRKIEELELSIENCERECAIQEELQLKMRLEQEEAESRWMRQRREICFSRLKENFLEKKGQLMTQRDSARKVLNQLTSTEGAAPDLQISLITFLNKLDEALVFLEEDFKERSSRAGEGRPIDSFQFSSPLPEPRLPPPLHLLLSLPSSQSSIPAAPVEGAVDESAVQAPVVKKGKAGMLHLLCYRIPNLTISSADHYFEEVKNQHKGSLTGVPKEEIVRSVESLLDLDLGRSREYQEPSVSECSICLDGFEEDNCATLECGHSFHHQCIKRWMKKCREGSGGSCPNCRSDW